MEVFGAVASAIGVVGVTAQTVEVIKKVKDFVKEVKDAPADVKNVANELQILAKSLSGIELHVRQTRQPAFSDPSPALLYCQQGIDQISTLVTELGDEISPRRRRGAR